MTLVCHGWRKWGIANDLPRERLNSATEKQCRNSSLFCSWKICSSPWIARADRAETVSVFGTDGVNMRTGHIAPRRVGEGLQPVGESPSSRRCFQPCTKSVVGQSMITTVLKQAVAVCSPAAIKQGKRGTRGGRGACKV